MAKNTELMDFLLHKTRVHELCVVRDAGYVCFVAYIDHEDLFLVPPRLQRMPVKSHKYGTLPVRDEKGEIKDAPCHYVDV